MAAVNGSAAVGAKAPAEGKNRILTKMLDRLFAALVNGPSLNCRPHSSRQRVDWTHLGRLKDLSAEDALHAVLGAEGEVTLTARVPMPKRRGGEDEDGEDDGLSAEERAGRSAWSEQTTLLGKLRGIAEDAKTYEQDTGVHVLYVGFPLLSLPPGMAGGGRSRGATKRILAPVALVPVSVTVKTGATSGVVISCKGEGVDRVVPNTALLAWLEQQTGKAISQELFEDEEGVEPWREVAELVKRVCEGMGIGVPKWFAGQNGKIEHRTSNIEHPTSTGDARDAMIAVETDPIGVRAATRPRSVVVEEEQGFRLKAAPKADDTVDEPTIYLSAVLGLFPMANQGLLRDMQAMAAGEPLAGPVTSFIQANVNLDAPPETGPDVPQQPVARRTRVFTDERLVAQADPCQARAVRLARTSRGLVIHGPPGTGKSQTITNIIGDHLARGDRVLVVSDKRTALDVVANRLVHMGLGNLVALIHDPQRDQRDLYRTIRDQLEVLAEATTDEKAEQKLAKVDAELQELHRELTGYWDALMKEHAGDSFHELVGRWVGIADSAESQRLEPLASQIKVEALDQHAHLIGETLDRAARVRWWENEWRDAAGVELATFVATPMDKWRSAIGKCVETAAAADTTLDPNIPPFGASDLRQQGQARADLAGRVESVLAKVPPEVRTRWASADATALDRARRRLAEVEPQWKTMMSGPMEAELSMTARDRLPNMGELATQLGALEQFLAIAGKWHAFLHFKRKSAAQEVTAKYGLPLTPPNAQRLRDFLAALRSRLVVQAVHYELYQVPPAIGLLADDVLDR